MLTISQTNRVSTGEFLDNALSISESYGFSTLDALFKTHKPAKALKQNGTPLLSSTIERRLAQLTKQSVAHKLHRTNAPHLTYELNNTSTKVSTLGLHSFGCTDAMSEGIIMSALATIARESDISNFTMYINSIGDRESSVRFMKELICYLRSNLNNMPGYARDEMQTNNPIKAFNKLIEKNHELVQDAPRSMEYLNDDSRAHLHAVLEYAESINIPYELDQTLFGSNDCWQHTLFELRIPRADGSSLTIASGGRHDYLSQKSFRVVLPVVSAYFEHEIRGRTKPRRRTNTQAKFFFAQLGPQAKKKGLPVLEYLRKSDVLLAHKMTVASIGEQLSYAEERDIPYTIIMGHKEAIEDSAIVRNMNDRSQVIVSIENLPSYLKRLKV